VDLRDVRTDAETAGPDGERVSGEPSLAEARLTRERVLAQKSSTIGELASGIAHDLANPLAAIVGFGQLIATDPRLPADLRSDAEALIRESERARRIVQNLLDFLRTRPPERHPTPIEPLVRSVLDLQTYALSGPIVAAVDIEAGLPPVPLDRSAMQQVLLNLTRNAVQAIGDNDGRGRIEIRASAEGDGELRRVRIVVTDDGPGVAPGIADRMFEPYVTSRAGTGALGMGLPISVAIVAAHGGTLRYEPSPRGGGASFVVALPVEPVPEVAAHETPEPTRPATTSRRVLVLDDEPSLRRFVGKVLEADGFTVLMAEDGRDAVRQVEAGRVDAVLCDQRMIGMTGIDVYRAVTAIRPDLAARFVIMSGDTSEPALVAFASQNRIRLLPKPFDVASLREIVRATAAEGDAAPAG
jgi:nitrogen-specific signal transduction histidine kinase/CheY-like chemotaxis protein